MRFVLFVFLVCVSSLTLCISGVRAGAFLQPDDDWQIITTSRFTGSTRAFDAKGKLVPVPSYTKFELGAYIEYGAGDWLTLILQPALARIYSEGPPLSQYYGLGSIEAGARVQLMRTDDVVISAQAIAHAPGSRSTVNPALVGNTGFEFDVRALVAAPFEIAEMPGFADAQLGYRVRRDSPADEIRFDVSLGIRPWSRLLLLAQSFNILASTAGGPGFPRMRQHKFQLSAVWDFSRSYSIQGGAFTTLASSNARQEYGMVTGVWYRF